MKKGAKILIVCLFLAGICLLLYPLVSNWLAVSHQSAVINEYESQVKDLNDQKKQEELQKARDYNATLSGAILHDPFIPGSGMQLPEDYWNILDVDGVMGYLDIPRISVHLPVFHGTGEDILTRGVGHLENTAMPVGGEGSHSVLTGHRGLSSAKLFTDLDQMQQGDLFSVSVLGETLTYQVDQIKVIEPGQMEDLFPVPGKDYLTLVTCTPYGINSHRLLVRGGRVANAQSTEEINPADPAGPVSAIGAPTWIWPLAAVGAIGVIVLVILLKKKRKAHRYRKGDQV